MIKGEMYVEDIVKDYPDSVKFLMDRGIICIRCGAPVWGTLFELLESREIKEPQVLIDELNAYLNTAG